MTQLKNVKKMLLCVMIGLVPCVTQAQDSAAVYPNRSIKMVVPFAAGGGTDIAARLVAGKLGETLGQSVVVENRLGAGGSLATEFVVRAPADGYTLLFHSGALAIDTSLKKDLSYNVRKDLTPISLIVTGPFLLVANVALPQKNVAELIAYAKANPKKLNFGSPGIGSSIHLAGELFKAMAGIDIVHVPYKGASPALTGLMANDIQIMFDLISTSKPLADAGKVKILGVSKLERKADMPGVPTISESGLAGYESAVWLGLLAPAGTDKAIIQKIAEAVKKLMAHTSVQAQFQLQGFDIVGSSPVEFEKWLSLDIDRYAKVIRDANIKLD
jgi:tripartite-type tricarboxylate transporter receptor subunit TctC